MIDTMMNTERKRRIKRARQGRIERERERESERETATERASSLHPELCTTQYSYVLLGC